MQKILLDNLLIFMSNIAKNIGKKGFISALFLDAVGIIFSSLINTSLTNTILNRIIYFCYCIRFELISLLFVLFLIYIVYYIIKNKLYTPWKIILFCLPFCLCFWLSKGNILKDENYYKQDHIYDDYYSYYDDSEYETTFDSLDEIENDSVDNYMTGENNQDSIQIDSDNSELMDENDSNYWYNSTNDDYYYYGEDNSSDIHKSENPFIQFVIARYYYFNNNFYEIESQEHFMRNAIKYQEERNWDQSIRYYSLAKAMYPEAYNVERIERKIERCEIVRSYCKDLNKRYILPIDVRNELTLNAFICSRALSLIWPKQYGKQYEQLKNNVINAIDSYPDLYKSCNRNDYNSCKKLIKKYGWCWFDHEFLRMLNNPNNDADTIMNWLKKYLQYEDVSRAKDRLFRTWLSYDEMSYE